ncbi:MAG: CoB--CoM heterodisulfide reductase iron-sulfur subunit A family protein, partial [Deltaproteobacteria bacterium]|nr:CoB--CoM heterodisulfide reductase iron-sulfur subunit A family protein [Deltaproteobacteria bacterium]
MENQKIGVYICSGCDIDKAVDIEKLEGVAKNEYKVPVCRTHPFLCSQEGVQLLKEDQKNEGINSFVIAACSTRYHETTFDMGAENVVVRAPIREYVAWTLATRDEEGNVDEDTQMAGEDYVRMYTSKIKQHTLPVPYEQETNKDILVIGGGVTGMTAALEAAKAGYTVNLVEKSDTLGGYALNDKSMIPENPPFTGLVANNTKDLAAEAAAHAKISVHTTSTVASIAGEPGAFEVKLQGGDSAAFKAGAVVMATGSVPYDASKLTDLGIGYDNVISSTEFEAMAASGSLKKKDGSPAKNIAFIQCAGSRDPNHLSYCSNTCCMRSLKQAAYIREMDQDAKAFIIYRDMITPGQYEDFYRSQQDDPGVFLTKGDVVGVTEASDKGVSLDIDNTLLGDQIQLNADLVVLATGQVPSVLDGESVLNLEYRQGPELPELKHGYPDSHFICFPYETRRTGIFAAGTVRKPMDANFSKRDATGAALKAIQAAEMSDLGKRVHPRSGDMTYMDIFFNRCTDCKRCTEECPFGALNENDKGTPLPFPARCRACGTCMGACPERCISFPDFSIQSVGDMIK